MKKDLQTNLIPLWVCLCALLPGIGFSQSDCESDHKSPICMVRGFTIEGIDSVGGTEIFFPDIAYDDCNGLRIIDYYLVEEERFIDPGAFMPCGSHLMQTFVIDASRNYSVCEFTVKITCNDKAVTKSSFKERPVSSPQNDAYNLGTISVKWESGERGPGTISSDKGDPGGKSYGMYQISTNHGYMEDFLSKEGNQFKSYFSGLTIGSDVFDRAWREVADAFPADFAQSQHDFIERTHYNVFLDRLDPEFQSRIKDYSPVIKDIIWSLAVQHGPYSDILTYALAGIDLDVVSEQAIIDLIYKERSMVENGQMVYFPRVGSEWKAGLLQRFEKEKEFALQKLRSYQK